MPHLRETIETGSAIVGVVGLGYVGLPLAAGYGKIDYQIIGFDLSPDKVAQLNAGQSYIPDVDSADIAALNAKNLLTCTTDPQDLTPADVIFICVPTPFDEHKAPDLSYVESACQTIAEILRPGQMVILQSTTFPGTTEEVVLPILQKSGLTVGEDFFLAFSPERIDPGQVHSQGFNVQNTPKVVGGITETCTELSARFLSELTPQVHPVSSPSVAEMSKLLENTFRSVNIALVNELALLCDRMKLDVWEVIDAAKTKPFGYMPFYPGAGVGGHCIPVDPYYLSWKARAYDFYTKFIELAAEVNSGMPYFTVEKIAQALNQQGQAMRGANILVLGVAFKRDIDDARNSPAERVIELLLDAEAKVNYHDPHVPRFQVGGTVFQHDTFHFESVPLSEATLAQTDCVAIITGHSKLNYQWVAEHSSVVVDTANVTAGFYQQHPHIMRLGAP